MYFLHQYISQLKAIFIASFEQNETAFPINPDDAAPSASESAAADYFQENFWPDINTESLGASIEELEERLKSLTLSEQFVSTKLRIILSGLTPIAEGKVAGYSMEDEGYIQLRKTVESLQAIYNNLEAEWNQLNAEIQEQLRGHLWDVSESINTGPSANEATEGFEWQAWFALLSTAEKENYSLLVRDRESSVSEYNQQRSELSQEHIDLLWDSSALLQPSEESLDDTATYQERVDMVQRDIDKIDANTETLRLQILLLENPESLSARHELLGGVFDALPEEQREWLIGNTIESLTAGDIYSMKERWVDLSTVFMVKENWELSLGKDTMNTGDMLRVNFGPSQAADKIIGAGDILDISGVYSVKINGVEGIRRFEPRPGYYTESGRYLAIHDGYQVQIWEKKEVTQEELDALQAAQKQRFEYVRTEDIQNEIAKLEGDNPEIPFTSEADIALLETHLSSTGIEWLAYNSETRTLDLPEGMNFGDVREVMWGYGNVIQSIATFISENNSAINAVEGWETLQLQIEWYSRHIIQWALSAIVWEDMAANVSYDVNTWVITTSGDLKIENLIGGSYEYAGNGTRHLRYMSDIRAAVSGTDVPMWALITLIYKENGRWDPTATPGTSSAYWLWQMIDSTWGTYGRGLNRNNPRDQLISTVRYMEAIQSRKNCPWEHVLAYYNTWEWINNISLSRARHFASINPAITAKIPWGMGAINSPRVYFTWAVAYYNDLTFEQARATMV